MAMASTVKEYLKQQGIQYDLVTHRRTQNSLETADMAHIPGDKLAKAVVLEDDNGYVLAVVPATRHIDLERLHKQLNRELQLASEQELSDLFSDCELGAIPPVGKPYGFDVIVDDALSGASDVYFEGGDHSDLVHISGESFRMLMSDAAHGRFSREI